MATIPLLKRDAWEHNRTAVITPGYIEELDDEGRLLEEEYPYYRATEEGRDGMGEMCDPYEGL